MKGEENSDLITPSKFYRDFAEMCNFSKTLMKLKIQNVPKLYQEKYNELLGVIKEISGNFVKIDDKEKWSLREEGVNLKQDLNINDGEIIELIKSFIRSYYKMLWGQTNFTLKKIEEIEYRAYLTLIITELENYFSNCISYIWKKKDPNITDKCIEKELYKIMRKSYQNILAYTREILEIKHSVSLKDSILLQNFREIRHLYVHGEGRIDEKFYNKRFKPKYFPKIEINVGRKFQLTDDLIFELWGVAIDVAKFFDIGLTELYPELITDFY